MQIQTVHVIFYKTKQSTTITWWDTCWSRSQIPSGHGSGDKINMWRMRRGLFPFSNNCRTCSRSMAIYMQCFSCYYNLHVQYELAVVCRYLVRLTTGIRRRKTPWWSSTVEREKKLPYNFQLLTTCCLILYILPCCIVLYYPSCCLHVLCI